MSSNEKPLTQSLRNASGKVDVFSFALWMALIICLYTIAVHFIAKWDGHFHDTKGCTTLQGFHGKLFKVNSCDSTIDPLDTTYDYKKTPESHPAEPAFTQPKIPQEPAKKLPPPKPESAAPKQRPYMI